MGTKSCSWLKFKVHCRDCNPFNLVCYLHDYIDYSNDGQVAPPSQQNHLTYELVKIS